ncbi:MAG: hypothetical protein EBV97_18425 [Rhodobacteraceae bacterium]|nr:hypothetical protein [Paracoccaceae bacterium]
MMRILVAHFFNAILRSLAAVSFLRSYSALTVILGLVPPMPHSGLPLKKGKVRPRAYHVFRDEPN